MAPTVQRWSLQSVFFLSGIPGLAAQLAWTRIFTAGLGHELPAVTGVVTAFFVGLAVGAWGLDRPISRSARPAWWYGGLECFAAGWILATLPVLTWANDAALAWVGLEASGWRQGLVSFLIPMLAIGPAAAALGGTLPAMERAVAPLLPDREAVAGLYAFNTAGAVAGVVGAVLWAMPEWGFRGTLMAAAAGQALCGVAGTWLGRGAHRPAAGLRAIEPESLPGPGHGLGIRRLRGLAFATGCLGIGWELLAVRAIAQVTENTIHTFAGALAVFLAATALGAAGQRWAARQGWRIALPVLIGGLGLVCGWTVAGLAWSGDGLMTLRGRLGGWGGEVGLAAIVVLVPATLMGACFSQIIQGARRESGGVGRALAWNTWGAACAGPVFIGWLLPWLGLKWSLAIVGLGYLGCLPWRWRGWRWVGPLAALAVLPVILGRLEIVELPPGARVTRFAEGRLATVAVVRTADGHRTLRVNNRFQQGGTASAVAARRHAHLPLLLHPEPRRALFLGVGTGLTLGAAAAHPGLQVDGVELLPEVVKALPDFEPENGAPQRRPGFRVWTADARRYVRTTTNRYDVVVADLFHPAQDGAGFLYTREHFAALRRCLAPGGLVCQWLPLHQLDLGVLRDIGRTFGEVFPGTTLWLLRFNVDAPVVGLVAGDQGAVNVDVRALEGRLGTAGLGEALGPLALNAAVRVVGCRLAGPESLARWVSDGGLATDDRPLVMYRAMSVVYEPRESPGQRLVELLGGVDPEFRGMPGDRSREEEGWLARLESFRVARDRHLLGLTREERGERREAVADYLASAAATADYTAGYAQAVLVASAYAGQDPAWARAILRRLIEVRPEQRLAREVLERMRP